MVLITVFSFLISLVVGVVIIRAGRTHAARYRLDMPQRFHAGAIPRIGGVALAGGTVSAWILSVYRGGTVLNSIDFGTVFAWVFALLPLVAGGLIEDMTHRLSARQRMLLSVIGSALAVHLLHLNVSRLGMPWLDGWWVVTPAAGTLLALLAVAGLPHAFNLIDGYNGLAGFVAVLICGALVHVALQVGDRQLAAMLMCMVGATAGFLVWNYPRGLFFAGDGGAYLWGGVIAIASITLVQRHAEVSPWFPMLLLIYPVWETIFSIYRKLARGVSPGVADALHFHQLIYRRIVREVFHDDEARRMLTRNNRTSPYLWGFTLLTVIPAVLFWRNTPVLMGFCALFVCTYVPLYLMIVRFKVPRWIRRGRGH